MAVVFYLERDSWKCFSSVTGVKLISKWGGGYACLKDGRSSRWKTMIYFCLAYRNSTSSLKMLCFLPGYQLFIFSLIRFSVMTLWRKVFKTKLFRKQTSKRDQRFCICQFTSQKCHTGNLCKALCTSHEVFEHLRSLARSMLKIIRSNGVKIL